MGSRRAENGSGSSHPKHVPGLVPPLGAFASALTWRLGLLVLADQGEEAAEALVLQDRRLRDAP